MTPRFYQIELQSKFNSITGGTKCISSWVLNLSLDVTKNINCPLLFICRIKHLLSAKIVPLLGILAQLHHSKRP